MNSINPFNCSKPSRNMAPNVWMRARGPCATSRETRSASLGDTDPHLHPLASRHAAIPSKLSDKLQASGGRGRVKHLTSNRARISGSCHSRVRHNTLRGWGPSNTVLGLVRDGVVPIPVPYWPSVLGGDGSSPIPDKVLGASPIPDPYRLTSLT
jgi:hypothetical protein